MSRPGPDAPEKVRNLVALDAENLMRRLRARRVEMISVFSRTRDRDVLLTTIRSWFEEADASALVHLRPEQQSALSAFYEAMDALRFYFRYTEDMPGTVERTLDKHLGELERHYVRLVKSLGGPVPVDLSDLTDVTPKKSEADAPPTVDGQVVPLRPVEK